MAETQIEKLACVALVRNEENSIAEWIAWQFALGFDTVLLFDYGSDDKTKSIAGTFAELYDIRVIDWPITTHDYRVQTFKVAINMLSKEFQWIAFFDTDEFLALSEGRRLREILQSCKNSGAIGVARAIFGSSDHWEMPSGGLIKNFTYRAPSDFEPNRKIKSIIRSALTTGVINPHFFEVQGPYTDLNGIPLTFSSPGVLASRPNYGTGKLHHYFVQSWSNWKKRLRQEYDGRTLQEAEFFVYDQNEVLDESALWMLPSLNKILLSLRPRAEKCAVVLVVKNESTDILAWLSWYHVLGFDSFIIYDDDSTDGTWEILNEAAKIRDIRLSRTLGDKNGRYEPRQEASYRHALNEYRDEFDWLAFFDVDEFLLLSRDSKIHEFLGRFWNAAGVAINWCNYGSSGHVLIPEQPPFEAFTWHASVNEMVNRHVKSIVRPSHVGPNWENVHCFDISPERYLLSNGGIVSWSETPGIISTDPNWSFARIMHYQCRSMEHFIQRMKKRPELAMIPGIWQAHDFRQVQTIVPDRIAMAVSEYLDSVNILVKK